jgi:hypothetical protein
MALVRVLARDGQRIEREVRIEADEATLGRGRDNVIVVADSSVSRLHARILATPRGYLLVDADSINGVWVAGQRIRHHFLESGEVFQAGDCLFQFVADDEPLTVVRRPTPTPPAADAVLPRAAARRGLALCGRCGGSMSAGARLCPQCGTGILARPRKSSGCGLWALFVLLLLAAGCVLGAAAYASRDTWLPLLRTRLGAVPLPSRAAWS